MFRYSVSNRSSCESTLSHDLSTSHSLTECSLGCPPPPNFSIQRMYFMIYAELIVRTCSRPLCSCFAAVLLICLSSCLCPREEHKIEWPVAQLLHGQRQQTEQAEINSTGMKLIFKMNAILGLPPAPRVRFSSAPASMSWCCGTNIGASVTGITSTLFLSYNHVVINNSD